jgi:hypothetical protein
MSSPEHAPGEALRPSDTARALLAAAIVLAMLWILELGVLRSGLLTSFRDQPPIAPLYAFWMPRLRPEALAFVLLAAALVALAPRLADAGRTPRAGFAAALLLLSALLPLTLFAVREPLSELGTNFAIYRNEEFFDDARRVASFEDAAGRGAGAFLRQYVEAMPRLSLHGQHFPPGHALWLHAVGELAGPSLFAAGASVLAAFALALGAAWRALATLHGEGAARVGALLCLAAPSLLDFACTSMDAVFLLWASLAWWGALRAFRPDGRAGHALLAGALLLVATCFSFAALPVGLAVLLHALWSGRAEPRTAAVRLALVGASYAGCAVALRAGTGFALWECLVEGRAHGLALMHEIVRGSPASRWALFSYGNLAAFAIGSGVALVAAAGLRLARGGLAADRWTPPALATLAILCAGGLFYLETERIWIFAMPWLAAIGASGMRPAAASLRLLLGAGLAQALVLEALLFTLW